MNEFKGTKGKWERITANWDLDQCVFLEDTEQEICNIKSEAHNQMYDAQLIAHAPEMLNFINRISGEMLRNDFVLDEKWHDKAKDLLTRATTIQNEN